MKARAYRAVVLSLFLAATAFGQASAGYLDLHIARVKPEKRAEFDAVTKKIAAIQRKNKGPNWTAAETIYGDWNTVYFAGQQPSYADAGQGFETFFAGLSKALGPAGANKLWQDFYNCVTSFRGEFRVRRLDLSRNAPADAATRAKAVAAARFTRTVIVRVRPGRGPEYEAQLKANNAAYEKAGNRTPVTVYQASSGQQGAVYYLSSLGSSLGSFDPSGPGLRDALGESGYQKYLKTVQEVVLGTETIINHYLPELSNPAEAVIAAGGDFWKPKAPAAPKAKPAEAGKK